MDTKFNYVLLFHFLYLFVHKTAQVNRSTSLTQRNDRFQIQTLCIFAFFDYYIHYSGRGYWPRAEPGRIISSRADLCCIPDVSARALCILFIGKRSNGDVLADRKRSKAGCWRTNLDDISVSCSDVMLSLSNCWRRVSRCCNVSCKVLTNMSLTSPPVE